MKQRVALFWPGDYRDYPNQQALPSIQAATVQLEGALRKLGREPYRMEGYLTRPHEAIEKLGPVDDPLVGVCVHWFYGRHTTDGVVGKTNPLLLASNFSGQWPGLVGLLNSIAVIYCSENRSPAALEFLAHFTDYVIPDHLVLLSISVPAGSAIDEIKLSGLPKNWRTFPAPMQLKGFGDEWAKKKGSLVLKVPSVMVVNEYNYLINPAHSDIGKVKIVKKEKFSMDERFLKR